MPSTNNFEIRITVMWLVQMFAYKFAVISVLHIQHNKHFIISVSSPSLNTVHLNKLNRPVYSTRGV